VLDYGEAAELDAAAWNMVRQVLDEPEWAKAFIRQQSDTAIIDAELGSYDALIEEWERKRGNYVKRLAIVDDATAALISAELRKLNPDLDAANARRASMLSRRENLDRIDTFLDRLSSHMASVDNLTYEEKHIIIDKLGVVAKVWPMSAPQRYVIEMAYDLDALAAQALEPEPATVGDEELTDPHFAPILNRLPSFVNKTGTSRCHARGRLR
jgi:hypothetical protein